MTDDGSELLTENDDQETLKIASNTAELPDPETSVPTAPETGNTPSPETAETPSRENYETVKQPVHTSEPR